jgi:hypothetical protein
MLDQRFRRQFGRHSREVFQQPVKPIAFEFVAGFHMGRQRELTVKPIRGFEPFTLCHSGRAQRKQAEKDGVSWDVTA